MENEITDLQQRLDFSKHERSDEGRCRSSNKLLLTTSLLFYSSPLDVRARLCLCL